MRSQARSRLAVTTVPDGRSYFAYGSNMIESQMHARAPSARLVGSARLDDFAFGIARARLRLDHKERPSAQRKVYGLLWEVTPACEASLDRHEGVSKGAYRRDTVIVAAEDGYREALVYIATDPTTGANRYGDRWPKILDAAKRHGFPAFYLTELVSFSL